MKSKSNKKMEWIFGLTMLFLIVLAVLLFSNNSNQKDELLPGTENHTHVFDFSPDDKVIWLGTHQGLYERVNNIWISTFPGIKSSDVMGLEVDPKNSKTIFISGHGYVKRSTNSGESWETVQNGLPENPDAHQLLMDSINPKHLFTLLASEGDNLYETMDGGESWSIAGSLPGTAYSIAISPIDNKSLLVGTEEGLFEYKIVNDKLQGLLLNNEGTYQMLALKDNVIVMNESGFVRSKDLKTWTPLNIPYLNGEMPLGIKASKYNEESMIIVTENLNVYRSSDGGQSWSSD